MSCHRNIVAFINRLPPNCWFATRQVLEFGTREAVDQALYRLVKSGFLTRIAWGVFTLRIDQPRAFEPLAVAEFKANVFKKTVVVHGQDIAKKLGLIHYGSDGPTFAVYGVSSSFQSMDQKIFLKNFSARKISLGDSPLGQAIRSLWFIGQKRCDRRAVKTVIASLTADEVTEITSSAHLMPGWLNRLVRYASGWQPQTIL